MDINYLLKREQHSLVMAQRAKSAEARLAHTGLARLYGMALVGQSFPHRQFDVSFQDHLDPSESPDRGNADA